MKVGLMQPYLFPYIGYFQLIWIADKFVVHDDVQYIRQGWINRNQIVLHSRKFLFVFSVKHDDYSIRAVRIRLGPIEGHIMNLMYKVKTSSEEIYLHLEQCDENFRPPLSSRVDLLDYAKKMFEKSVSFEACIARKRGSHQIIFKGWLQGHKAKRGLPVYGVPSNWQIDQLSDSHAREERLQQ